MASVGISLDVGGVLLEPNLASVQRAISDCLSIPLHEITGRNLREALYTVDAGMDPAGGKNAAEEFLRRYVHQVTGRGVADTADLHSIGEVYEWSDWQLSPFLSYTDDLSTLLAMYPVVLTTNGRGDTEERLRIAGLSSLLEHKNLVGICDSAILGYSKPSQEIFDRAYSVLGTDRMVHIGDSLNSDVNGSVTAGYNAVHYVPMGTCSDDRHGHISRLRELVRIIERP